MGRVALAKQMISHITLHEEGNIVPAVVSRPLPPFGFGVTGRPPHVTELPNAALPVNGLRQQKVSFPLFSPVNNDFP